MLIYQSNEKNPEVGVISVHGLVIKGCIEWKSKARMAICRNYEWSGKRQGARLRPLFQHRGKYFPNLCSQFFKAGIALNSRIV